LRLTATSLQVAVYAITNYTSQTGSTTNPTVPTSKGDILSTVSMVSPIYNPIDANNARASPGASYNVIAAAGGDNYDYEMVHTRIQALANSVIVKLRERNTLAAHLK
jgi:hypothetical protein